MGRDLIYKKLFENIVLYNQFKNNMKYNEALKFSRYLLKINDLILKRHIINGENSIEQIKLLENKIKKDMN